MEVIVTIRAKQALTFGDLEDGQIFRFGVPNGGWIPNGPWFIKLSGSCVNGLDFNAWNIESGGWCLSRDDEAVQTLHNVEITGTL